MKNSIKGHGKWRRVSTIASNFHSFSATFSHWSEWIKTSRGTFSSLQKSRRKKRRKEEGERREEWAMSTLQFSFSIFQLLLSSASSLSISIFPLKRWKKKWKRFFCWIFLLLYNIFGARWAMRRFPKFEFNENWKRFCALFSNRIEPPTTTSTTSIALVNWMGNEKKRKFSSFSLLSILHCFFFLLAVKHRPPPWRTQHEEGKSEISTGKGKKEIFFSSFWFSICFCSATPFIQFIMYPAVRNKMPMYLTLNHQQNSDSMMAQETSTNH